MFALGVGTPKKMLEAMVQRERHIGSSCTEMNLMTRSNPLWSHHLVSRRLHFGVTNTAMLPNLLRLLGVDCTRRRRDSGQCSHVMVCRVVRYAPSSPMRPRSCHHFPIAVVTTYSSHHILHGSTIFLGLSPSAVELLKIYIWLGFLNLLWKINRP